MSWDHLSNLNDGRRIVYAYCAGKNGRSPCGHNAKLDLGALIEEHGDISGASATITMSWSK